MKGKRSKKNHHGRREIPARRGWLPRRAEHRAPREVQVWPLPRRQLKKRRGLKLGMMCLHTEVGYLGVATTANSERFEVGPYLGVN